MRPLGAKWVVVVCPKCHQRATVLRSSTQRTCNSRRHIKPELMVPVAEEAE
jgi:hypothetical protein